MILCAESLRPPPQNSMMALSSCSVMIAWLLSCDMTRYTSVLSMAPPCTYGPRTQLLALARAERSRCDQDCPVGSRLPGMSSSIAWRKRPVTRALGMAPSSMTKPSRAFSSGCSLVPLQSIIELIVGPIGL